MAPRSVIEIDLFDDPSASEVQLDALVRRIVEQRFDDPDLEFQAALRNRRERCTHEHRRGVQCPRLASWSPVIVFAPELRLMLKGDRFCSSCRAKYQIADFVSREGRHLSFAYAEYSRIMPGLPPFDRARPALDWVQTPA